ncbi:MAG: ATP-binding cassette domain-containing protein [Oligoflexia bacterium]|nr:ATP-binding cassette domain-containing protein [Oligoflexia bacterium]
MSASIIQIKNLYYTYSTNKKNVPVLHDINLNINHGEMIAIQGKSGSGKSTLLYLIGGTLKIKQGEILIANQNLCKLNSNELAQFRQKTLGFVFQQFHLLSHANVLENVLLPLSYSSTPSSTSATTFNKSNQISTILPTILNTLGIQDVVSHFPNELSGGQQQRTAIARALINDPQIILADEPTGNLDSKTSNEIITLFKELKAKNKTIIIVTHDNEIAKECDRIYHIQDGIIIEEITNKIAYQNNQTFLSNIATSNIVASNNGQQNEQNKQSFNSKYNILNLLSSVKKNLKQNKIRTLLTMIGITIGVASMISMVTLGLFTKSKVIESFSELGANIVNFNGYRNWELKASDITPVMFESFSYEKDLLPLKRIFPEIMAFTPTMMDWNVTVTHGANILEKDIRLNAMSADGWNIIEHKELLKGKYFNNFHVDDKSAVCIIGFDINKNLFKDDDSLGKIISIKANGDSQFVCKIIGVLKETSSNKDWLKPNNTIHLPFTFYLGNSRNFWQSQIRQFLIKTNPDADIELFGKKIKLFFEKKYGISGKFFIGYDSALLSQMEKVLTLFTIILGVLASICLTVGGVGVANMMMVSVAERYREIGIRKAIGASDQSIRLLFLSEAIIICFIAGIAGLFFGIVIYESIIFVASSFIPKIQFEWVFNYWALSISLISIIIVGILAGIIPAIKAERLQIIEALRAE